MTAATELTARTWSATATSAGATAYSSYFAGTLLPQLRELPGFTGAYLLRRDLDETETGTGTGIVELTAHTFWQSPEAISAFAGDDITRAIVEPEAQAMLLDYERTATHRSVAISCAAPRPASPAGEAPR
jgi:heme-degrading monooxygenase HmoA